VVHIKRKRIMADQLPITIRLKKINNELVCASDLSKSRLSLFVKSLDEGETVDVTYEVISDSKSYAQLSKVHKCIREIASFTGMTVEEVKTQVKLRSGLCNSTDCKSFADCSKDELSLAIQAVIEIGDLVGFNLH
jgi:hypothetical protein